MYLGEIVRLILVSLIDASPKSLLFSGHSSSVLNKQYGFDTSVMSAIEEAWIGDDPSPEAFVHPAFTDDFNLDVLSPKVVSKLEHIKNIVVRQAGVDGTHVSLRDAAVRPNLIFHFTFPLVVTFQIVRWICSLVARRAALLSGVAISAVLIQQGYASFVGENKPIRNQNDTLDIGVDGRCVSIPKSLSLSLWLCFSLVFNLIFTAWSSIIQTL